MQQQAHRRHLLAKLCLRLARRRRGAGFLPAAHAARRRSSSSWEYQLKDPTRGHVRCHGSVHPGPGRYYGQLRRNCVFYLTISRAVASGDCSITSRRVSPVPVRRPAALSGCGPVGRKSFLQARMGSRSMISSGSGHCGFLSGCRDGTLLQEMLNEAALLATKLDTIARLHHPLTTPESSSKSLLFPQLTLLGARSPPLAFAFGLLVQGERHNEQAVRSSVAKAQLWIALHHLANSQKVLDTAVREPCRDKMSRPQESSVDLRHNPAPLHVP